MRTKSHTRPRMLALIGAVMLVGAALALAACGGSGSSSTKNAAATTSTGSGKDRRAALRECLEKQGVKLPSAPAGGQPGSGQPPAGGGQPPAGGGGFTPGGGDAKTREAFQKCGGGNFGGRPRNSAAFKASLTKFAACMRENGVNLPAPNTSGQGPVFDTKGIDTSSTAFKSAQSKCRSALKGSFGGGGAPPSGQQGPPAGAPGEEAGA